MYPVSEPLETGDDLKFKSFDDELQAGSLHGHTTTTEKLATHWCLYRESTTVLPLSNTTEHCTLVRLCRIRKLDSRHDAPHPIPIAAYQAWPP